MQTEGSILQTGNGESLPRTFETVVAGLAGDGGVRKGGMAHRGKSEWCSLDPKRYCDPDERGDTGDGIVDRREEWFIRYPHMIEKSTFYSGLRNVFGMIFFYQELKSIIGRSVGRGRDPEAKSYVFTFIFSYRAYFYLFWPISPFSALLTRVAPCVIEGLVSGGISCRFPG